MGAILAIYIRYFDKGVKPAGFLSILIIVLCTLLYGLLPGISNTAHVVGLLSGACLGLVLFKGEGEAKPEIETTVTPTESIARSFESEVTPPGEIVVIDNAIGKALKLLILSIIMTALMVVGLTTDGLHDSTFHFVIGVLGFILFTSGIVISIIMMCKGRKILTIRPEGFEYKAHRNSYKFISWRDVRKISVLTLHAGMSDQEFLCVDVDNRNEYFGNPNRFAQFLTSIASTDSAIQIPFSLTKADVRDVERQMIDYCEKYKNAQRD